MMKTTFTIILTIVVFGLSAQTDQTLDWFTYFGGTNIDRNNFISELSTGELITAGEAESSGLAFGDAHQNAHNGEQDAWITKWGADGSPIWSTYYGGANFDYVLGLSIDNNDNIVVVGYTQSEDFIAYGNAHQEEKTAFNNAFIAKFDSNGQIIWGTYLSGDVSEVAEDIAIDADNNIYISGVSHSENMSEINTYSGGGDGFIAKFNPEGGLEWFLYRGGELDDRGRSLVLKDSHIYNLYSTKQQEGLATPGAEEETGMGETSLVLECLSNNGDIIWSRYVSGTNNETLGHLAANETGLFLATNTNSMEGLGTEGAFAETKLMEASHYSFVLAKFSFDGLKEWGTYFGEVSKSTSHQASFSLSVSEQHIFFSTNIGSTTTGYIFGENPFQPNNNSNGGQPWQGKDALVMKWDLDGFPVFGTLFGGNFGEGNNGVMPIMDGEKIVIAGSTDSEDFYQSSNSYQEELAGGSDAFVAVLSDETLSVTEFLRSEEIIIYPNPQNAHTNLSIELAHDIDKMVLMGIQGKVLMNWENLGLNPTIQIEDFQSGVYILKIYTEQGIGIKRVVIE